MSAALNIVADQQILQAQQIFSSLGNLQLVDGRAIDPDTVKDADALLVRSVTPVNASLLDNSRVRFVGSATAGIDHVDLDYLDAKGITFAYAPGSNARAVAEYVLSSLLFLAEQDGFDLADKTIGIIGVGEVGSRVRSLLQVLGMRCLLNDPPRADLDNSEHWVELEALREADILTCHVPLTRTDHYPTQNLINGQFLQQLKPDVILLNTARGGVFNESDLEQFIAASPAARTVVDVWCDEPDIDRTLLENATLATPHIAGYSYDGKLKASLMLARALAEAESQSGNASTENEEEVLCIDIDNPDNALFDAVMQVYDVSRDSRLLKKALELEPEACGSYFDQLRKNYPVRREFGSVTVRSQGLREDSKRRLKAIGFKLDA